MTPFKYKFKGCFIVQENNTITAGSIIIENRKVINLSGVSECLGFDEETILLDTKLGKLTIKGNSLHIQNFNTATGELTAEGRIHAVAYTVSDTKQSFFGKIFR
ncbi:MAG: sporulation protein YabP [Clostridia bacterium]|nr:sporulation protein YabP [Clostridia bacterium]